MFKKINEGLEVFDGLYERHGNSANSSQKDKLESDLKKEIKKLQRFREQIKNWQSTNEVKDKEKLLEYRKLVETAMEQYKTVEKNSKTKAYSDQSLMSTRPKEMDPEEKERYDTIQFLNNSLSDLEHQIEALEADLDKLQAGKKGKKGGSYADNERKAQVIEFLRVDKFHQEKWEQMLRLLENDVLQPQQVNEIKDGIEYFLESNQDAEFYEDDTIYDELNLDENDLVNEVNISLKEQKEEEEKKAAEAEAAKRQSTTTTANTTPVKSKPVDIEPVTKVVESVVTSANSSSSNLQRVTPLTTSFAAAALSSSSPATQVSLSSTLKPAPFPAKPKADISWSAAVSGNLQNNDNNAGSRSMSPQTSSSSPMIKNRSSSPSTTVNNGTGSVTSTTPLQSYTTTSAAEAMKLKQSLSSTIKSASLLISESNPLSADAEIAEDEDLLLLPPGLQDIILSFVTVRRSVKLAKPIDSCATLLRGYRDFSPLPERVVPSSEEAQKAYNTWMFMKSKGKITDLINKVDDATLFFIYYYSILPMEKKLAEEVLFAKGWKLHKSNIYWLQRLTDPMVFQNYEQGHYRVFDATKWSVQEHPGFQLVYADFRPEQNLFSGVSN